MSDPLAGRTFNIIKHRGDPKQATLIDGTVVKKEEHVYFQDDQGRFRSVRTADYHGEHFVYINPFAFRDGEQWKGQWFALCTCGSGAVIIDPMMARLTHGKDYMDAESLLVCHYFTGQVLKEGAGAHITGHRRWW